MQLVFFRLRLLLIVDEDGFSLGGPMSSKAHQPFVNFVCLFLAFRAKFVCA